MSPPWKGDLKCGTGSADAWIFDEDGDDVAQAHPYVLPAIARDRAASLVHRVNAYDGLVEALEIALPEMVNYRSQFEPDTDEDACIDLDMIVALVQDALAAAKEGE